jgi:lectin, mannose-binding 1
VDQANQPRDFPLSSNSAVTDDPPEVDADKVDTTRQFADLHNRLQALMKHVSYLERNHREGRSIAEQKLSAIHYMMSKQQYGSGSSGSSGSESKELLDAIDKRIQAMETKFSDLARQIEHIKFAVGDKGHIEDLKRTVKETHSSLLSAAPKHGLLIFIILGSQAALVAGYVYYERRKAKSSKKYL